MSDDLLWNWRWKNWLRWCVSNPRLSGHCGSIEYRYKSPQADVWDPPEPKPQPIDSKDAVIVNRAFTYLDARNQRIIKVIYFCSHWRASWQAQKIGCKVADLSERAYQARRALRNLLQLQESKARVTQNPGRYGKTVISPPSGAVLSLEAV